LFKIFCSTRSDSIIFVRIYLKALHRRHVLIFGV
jgi:hypothetical protein